MGQTDRHFFIVVLGLWEANKTTKKILARSEKIRDGSRYGIIWSEFFGHIKIESSYQVWVKSKTEWEKKKSCLRPCLSQAQVKKNWSLRPCPCQVRDRVKRINELVELWTFIRIGWEGVDQKWGELNGWNFFSSPYQPYQVRVSTDSH